MPANTTSVRSLVTSVTDLANHLGKTPNAIYRWIDLDRIPAGSLIKVAAFYDIEIPFHLAQSKKKSEVKINYKPRDTLPMCLKVQQGEMTIAEAAHVLGLHERAVQLILTNWGEHLGVLYDTLVRLDNKEISLDQAAMTLNVTKFTIHALRKKYGFRPAPREARKERPIVQRRQTTRQVALDCIAGRLTLADISKNATVSWRTVHRMISKLSPDIGMIDLTHWPKSFRQAYAVEIERSLPRISVNLWEFSKTRGVLLKKWPKYPEFPKDLRKTSMKRLMAHVLLGDRTLEEVAAERGGDASILANLFTSDLRPLSLTWQQVKDMPMEGQVAVAELLLAVDDQGKTPRSRMIEKLAEVKNDQ